jgi:hypothetical protein
VEQLDEGLWRWTGRHPEWHPADEFGAEVASFALRDGGDTILIDPLLPEGDASARAGLDAIVRGRLRILITIPYHVRSAELIWRRYGAEHTTTIWGHPAAARRLSDTTAFRPLTPGEPLAGGIVAHPIGNPRRFEMPLHLPAQRALAFGDAVVSVDGQLRVWLEAPITERRLAWYRRRFVPTLEPLLAFDIDRVLVTHGPPVLRDGRRALAAALAQPPWCHAPR